MSLTVTETLRNHMLSSSALTALVNSTNIKVGWGQEWTSWPTVVLHQTGGANVGLVGFNTSTSGNRNSIERALITVDILSDTSPKNTYDIADVIVPIMISSGCRKVQDVDLFEDDKKVHRKVLSFQMYQPHTY